MELSEIIEKLETQIEETDGSFKVDLDFHEEKAIIVVAGNIYRSYGPGTRQFSAEVKSQELEITECWIQFPDFEAEITDVNIIEIEKHFEL